MILNPTMKLTDWAQKLDFGHLLSLGEYSNLRGIQLTYDGIKQTVDVQYQDVKENKLKTIRFVAFGKTWTREESVT